MSRIGAASHPLLAPLSESQVRARALGFYLDMIDIARDGGGLLGRLLLAVVLEANIAPINRDPALQRRFATLRNPPSDDLRRPIRISAVAASLRLPFETVRRRIHDMAREGQCVVTGDGVLLTTTTLAKPQYVKIVIARWRRLRALVLDLAPANGLVSHLAGARDLDHDAPDADEPVLLCNRLITRYSLRITDLILAELGDPVSSFIFLNLVRASMGELQDTAAEGTPRTGEGPRKPAARLASEIGLAPETVRRRLFDLERRQLISRGEGGVALMQSPASLDLAARLGAASATGLNRLLTNLETLDVLDRWCGEALRRRV